MPISDIHILLQSWLDHGWLRDPQAVGLSTFEAQELVAHGFYPVSDVDQLCLYEDERLFRRAGRPVHALFKAFLQRGQLVANGLGLGDQVHLAGFLRAARQPLPAFRVLLEQGGRSGALLFENGLVLQFSANLRGKPRHYYLTLVEGNVADAHVPDRRDSDIDLRAAAARHVQALYDSRDTAELQRLARRGNAALRELARLLS
ncbi:hypothetical protein CSQ93_01370 [Janthinobacterium sp. BJB426]|uniref:hypothetical protein n=1 Tax=Janthinobacterium sp. BJB426 TaxID=2048010 RepID=UPI000C0FA162|nr:hypothetical protein [Janthinobacterium sp. BJB426]PHV29810.1 hypothetical protein CSQ93_01370 [Janthinobacterium sp. BJB426]